MWTVRGSSVDAFLLLYTVVPGFVISPLHFSCLFYKFCLLSAVLAMVVAGRWVGHGWGLGGVRGSWFVGVFLAIVVRIFPFPYSSYPYRGFRYVVSTSSCADVTARGRFRGGAAAGRRVSVSGAGSSGRTTMPRTGNTLSHFGFRITGRLNMPLASKCGNGLASGRGNSIKNCVIGGVMSRRPLGFGSVFCVVPEIVIGCEAAFPNVRGTLECERGL